MRRMSASAAWQMPSCWTALGNLHKAFLMTDVSRHGQRWRDGASEADGCDERKVIQNDGRTGRASGEHWSSKSQPDFPGDRTAPASERALTTWPRVTGTANDMISFWIYISGFIDDVRLFGRRKQIHLSSYRGWGGKTWYRSGVIVWRRICRSPPFSELSDGVSSVRHRQICYFRLSSPTGRRPYWSILTVAPLSSHRIAPEGSKCPSRDHVTHRKLHAADSEQRNSQHDCGVKDNATRSTQPSIHPGLVNKYRSLMDLRRGVFIVSCGQLWANTVIPHGKWHPVALRWSSTKSSTLLNLS